MSAQYIDLVLDRYLAVSAAMNAWLCLLVLAILLVRAPHKRRPGIVDRIDPLRAAPALGPVGLLAAGRVGFASLVVRYLTTTLARLDLVTWWAFSSDIVLLACDIGVIGAALYAIRQTTFEICGNRALYIFGGSSLAVGVLVFFLGD